MEDEFKRKLQLIEDRIVQINDRESRQTQYRLSTYSTVLGAIIALLILLIIEFVKLTLSGEQFVNFIFLSIYVCFFIGAIIWVKSRELMDIGDFEFSGNLDLEDNEKSSFLKDIEILISTKNKSLKKKIHPSFKGLNILGYWYSTSINCDFNDKFNNISGKTHLLNNVTINYYLEISKNRSQIFLDFKKKEFVTSLSDKHFATKDAKEILDKLRDMRDKYNFLKDEESNIRGF